MAPITLTEVAVDTAETIAADITDLTTGALNGSGAFDQLMAATKLHLIEEYEKGRITGDEYTTVYLGAMQSVLAQSVQYLVNQQTQEKVLAEIGLIRQKTVTELAQTDNLIVDGLGFNDSTAVEGLVAEQILVAKQQVLESTQKVLTAIEETTLIQQKVITELLNSETATTGLTAPYGAWSGGAFDGMAIQQIDKVQAEAEHIRQKTVTEIANVSNALPDTYAESSNTTLEGLLEVAKLKTEAEVDLLDQKTVSELAQTYNTIPVNEGLVATGYPVAGIMGAQKALFDKQTDGFDRDAEQKLAKIFSDMKATQIAADSDTTMTNTYMTNEDIGQIMVKAGDGIGVALADQTVGTLSLTGQPLNTETVTIGLKTYTFQSTLTNVDGNVHIGATSQDSIDNLIAAITLGSGAGTAYASATTAHPSIALMSLERSSNDMILTVSSTSLATLETLTNGSWGGPITS
jgi:hypothetical protein